MSAAQRITVRNIHHSITDEDIELTLTHNFKTPAATSNNKLVLSHIYQQGEAPSKHKNRGPIPGWLIITISEQQQQEGSSSTKNSSSSGGGLTKKTAQLTEKISNYFDCKPFSKIVADTSNAVIVEPFQLCSVEYSSLQDLSSSNSIGSRTPSAKTDGSIFDDPHFLKFKQNLESSADEPIPCSQENAFEFLNKWLEKEEVARENSLAYAEKTRQTVRVGGRRVRKEVTFLERVRLRYDEEKRELAEDRRKKEEKAKRKRDKEEKKKRKERERQKKADKERAKIDAEREKRCKEEALAKLKSSVSLPASLAANSNSSRNNNTNSAPTAALPSNSSSSSKNRDNSNTSDNNNKKEKKEKKEKREKKDKKKSSSSSSGKVEDSRSKLLAALADDSDDDDEMPLVPAKPKSTSASTTTTSKNTFTVSKTSNKHTDPTAPASNPPTGKKIMLRAPAPKSSTK